MRLRIHSDFSFPLKRTRLSAIDGCFLSRYDVNVSTKIRIFLCGDKNSPHPQIDQWQYTLDQESLMANKDLLVFLVALSD